MVIVICEVTKKPYLFPDAIGTCLAGACPDPACQKRGSVGLCVTGRKNKKIVCLKNFPQAGLDFSCGCKDNPCDHMTEGHAAMDDIVTKLIRHHEPPEARRSRMQAAYLAKLNGGEVTTLEPSTPALNVKTGRRSVILKEPRGYRYLTSFAPDMLTLLPLKERKDTDA